MKNMRFAKDIVLKKSTFEGLEVPVEELNGTGKEAGLTINQENTTSLTKEGNSVCV